MNDLVSIDLLLKSNNLEILILVFSLLIMFLILLLNNKNLENQINELKKDSIQIKKSNEIHGTYLKQFNDHFGLVDQRLKNVEEITTITGRDIASMADGITGEVGVGKAIELARNGASVEEIVKKSNLKQDQAELIFKFHGVTDPTG